MQLQQINNLTDSQKITMSSREIAQLIEKQHSNIKISAERLAEAGVIGTLASQEFTHNGNVYTEYLLNKRDSLILVAQNCPQFTARIVDRWQELEAQQKPAASIPQTYAQALLEAGRLALELEQKELQLQVAKPKVEFVDTFVDRGSNRNITSVAKELGITAIALGK